MPVAAARLRLCPIAASRGSKSAPPIAQRAVVVKYDATCGRARNPSCHGTVVSAQNGLNFRRGTQFARDCNVARARPCDARSQAKQFAAEFRNARAAGIDAGDAASQLGDLQRHRERTNGLHIGFAFEAYHSPRDIGRQSSQGASRQSRVAITREGKDAGLATALGQPMMTAMPEIAPVRGVQVA